MRRHSALARYAPTSASVRRARRFTTEWAHAEGADAVADDAALVVSELASNAVLHARTDFEVHLTTEDACLRVEVWDESPTLPLSATLDAGAMSGRGLPLVHALADQWGVDALAHGKRVWASITDTPPPVAEDMTAEGLLHLWATLGEDPAVAVPAQAGVPVPPVVVVVPGMPVVELLAAKSHMDDLLREVQLVLLDQTGTRRATAAVLELARRLDGAARDVDSCRLQIRSQAMRSAEAGETVTTLELSLTPGLREAAVRYRRAIADAEALGRAGHLPSHAAALARHAVLRRTYLDAIIEQLAAAGG